MKKRPHLVMLLLILAPACVSLDEDPIEDPRLGDNGRVLFTGGGGCNGSTTLAVGSTATLTLEPQEEPIPGDLVVGATDPEVITAVQAESRDQIVLEALGVGESYVELRSGGELWDGLGFSAETATSATFTAPDVVLAGGTLVVAVEEVFGACGEECPLIGSDFMTWEGAPGSAFALLRDHERVASFTVGTTPGLTEIQGLEPSSGAALVTHSVEVVSPAEVGEIEDEIVIMLPDESILDPQPIPADIPLGAVFQMRLQVRDGDDRPIMITTHEAAWSIAAGAELLEPFGDEVPLEGPAYSTRDIGEVELIVDVPLLEQSRTFRITIVE